MATLQKNDFIEIEFTGTANDEIFDTTDKDVAKKMGLDADVKPLIISIGNQMLLKGLDDTLEGKEIEKKYTIHLDADKAFGKRNPAMVKIIPSRVFKEKNMNPYPGMTLQMDNYIAKVLSVSGGRVIVDFNNPLAGKEIDYEFTIKRKIEDIKEKIDSIQDFFFRQRFDYELKDNKVIFKKQEMKTFLDIFKEKFKTMTGMEFVVEEEKTKEPNSVEKK